MMSNQKENYLLEQFEKTKTFKRFFSTLLRFDEDLDCFVATEKWRNKEAELLTSAWWMFAELAKSKAVPEWKDYSQQSPRIDGRYQIFINGEQLAADWKSPFGFADPIEGVALIQELITHWAVLSADPVIEAQEQSHEH
jgi:hypothetical protein